ncbi:hypothetical protein [Microbacterium sp. Root180]|uniref:hypothetical protein n=1 Tax=Microbacterium sp. Root180 TaxID=1736483 RepID=UPI000701EB47|nr:hypothetical protein [Microbacterium sp. Root180]KRB36653.1 hypothetical protein ASD93_11420 [Microbacterium sp. Root180]
MKYEEASRSESPASDAESSSARFEPALSPAPLEAALEGVTDVVARIAMLLREGTAEVTARDVDIADLAAKSLKKLSSALGAAGALVESRATHAEWDSRFAARGRAERAARLQSELADDIDRGTVRWFEAWFDAMIAGAADEAWSVLRASVELAPWAVWLPDRAAALQLSVEYARDDPESAAALLGGLVDMLIDDEGAASDLDHVFGRLQQFGRDPVRSRVLLLVVAARVLALAGDSQADRLVEQARHLVGYAETGSQAALNRAVVTTESFLARHSVGTHRPGRSWAARGAVADLFAIHEYIELQRSEADADDPDGDRALADIQSLVDGLHSVAGGAERLDMIFETPAPELVLALATRLFAEREFERAQALLGQLDGVALRPELLVPASDLEVRITEATHPSSDVLADELRSAGNRALWSMMSVEARGYFERALEVRPTDAATMRGLADALQAGAFSEKDRAVAVRDLEAALELTARAAELSPITLADAWAHSLARAVYQQLYRVAARPRPEHPWLALGETVAAIRLGDVSDARWAGLVADLIDVGLMHTASFVADRLDPASPEALRARAYAALNSGRYGEAIELLDQVEPQPDEYAGWFDALRGIAYGSLGEIEKADECFDRARRAEDLLEYPNWAAEMHTRYGEGAGRLWAEVWKRSDLANTAQSGFATWAAIYQRAMRSARDLSEPLAPSCELAMAPCSADTAFAVVNIVSADSTSGWAMLRERFARTLVAEEFDLNRVFVREMLRRQRDEDPGLDARSDRIVDRFDGLVEEVRAEIESTRPAADSGALMHWEWDRAVRALASPLATGLIGDLREILSTDFVPNDEAGGGEPSESGSDAVAEALLDPASRTLRLLMGPEWVDSLSALSEPGKDPRLFVRGVLLARAALVRSGDRYTSLRPFELDIDDSLDRKSVVVELADGRAPITGFVDWEEWFAPEAWVVAQRPERVLRDASAIPGLVRVAPPADASDRVSSWSGVETLARLAYSIAATDDEGFSEQWNAQQS